MESIDNLDIPELKMMVTDHRRNFQLEAYLIYSAVIRNTEYGRALVERLTADDRIIAHKGQMIARGSGATAFDVSVLAMWFIWCAKLTSEKNANELLENWLKVEESEILNTLWVVGLDLDATIQLDNGYAIQKIDDMPDSNEKENYLTISRDFQGQGNLPKCAITRTHKIKKMWTDTPGAKSYVDEYLASSRGLYGIASILNSLGGVICVPFYQTSYISSLNPPGPFGGSGGGMPIYDVATHGVSKISNREKPLLEMLFSCYEKKDELEKNRLQLILSRISQAKRRTQIEDQILDLGIALEMLLLEENEKDQLSLQFRIRGSWLLGQSFDDRLDKSKLFNQIYDARSSVAHSGALHRTNPKKLELVRENLGKYVELAEATIQKIVLEGSPSWDNIMLRGVAAEPKPS